VDDEMGGARVQDPGQDDVEADEQVVVALGVAAETDVDLGLVGSPINNGSPQLLTDLLARGYVPVVACIGSTRDGQLLNVNADTLAAHLAASLGARRLVIAGGTSGVLDETGRTIERLDSRHAARLIKSGTANKGMVAKLAACRAALRQGVGDVLIANGREVQLDALGAATDKDLWRSPSFAPFVAAMKLPAKTTG